MALMLADLIKEQCEMQPAFILVSGDTAPEILQAANRARSAFDAQTGTSCQAAFADVVPAEEARRIDLNP